ncbi:MAG: VanZ family protein [Planctomycetes bacterium]|nr:VanZ family protein [Planctomycetota bacterium]
MPLLAAMDRVLAWWWRVPTLLRAALPVGCMVTLWWSSSREPAPAPPSWGRAFLHNGAHVVAYASLAMSLRMVFALEPRISVRRDVASWVLALAYGIVDELHQSHVPGRVCSVSDVFSDAAGAWLGLLLVAHGAANGPSGVRFAAATVVCFACVAMATFGSW